MRRQRLLDIGDLAFSPDEAGQLDGQADIRGVERRELRRQVGVTDLPEVFRFGQTFKTMPLQIKQCHAIRVPTREVVNGLTEEYLLWVRYVSDTGGAVDLMAIVVFIGDVGDAGM